MHHWSLSVHLLAWDCVVQWRNTICGWGVVCMVYTDMCFVWSLHHLTLQKHFQGLRHQVASCSQIAHALYMLYVLLYATCMFVCTYYYWVAVLYCMCMGAVALLLSTSVVYSTNRIPRLLCCIPCVSPSSNISLVHCGNRETWENTAQCKRTCVS